MTSVLGQRFIPFYIIQCVRGSNPISIWRLRLRHYLDRVHSDLNNMLFVQYVDRESRYNMWSRVKALLSHTFSEEKPFFRGLFNISFINKMPEIHKCNVIKNSDNY